MIVANDELNHVLKVNGMAGDEIEVIQKESLLTTALIKRLQGLYSEHSMMLNPQNRFFDSSQIFSGLSGFESVCAILKKNEIKINKMEQRKLFVRVYRFLATGHVLNSIQWNNANDDPIFHLVFPQPGMVDELLVKKYIKTKAKEEKEQLILDYIKKTNPHDGNQLLNKPWFDNDNGEIEILEGSQHKYPQVQLIFDKTTQNCFAFCTYCFRHAQVRGDEDMFIQEDVRQIHDYLKKHKEITDILITGGDAGFMTCERLKQYVIPLIEDQDLRHIRTIRLGSRLLSYHPDLILRKNYDNMLSLFKRMYDNGLQVAWMAHFSTPSELLNVSTIAAIRRLQNSHVKLRSQSPIMKNISLFVEKSGKVDVDKSAKNWIDLANILATLQIGFHSMYCPRPTGAHHYFAVPLSDLVAVFSKTYRSLASLNRPSRHLSMTISAGKVSILGFTQVDGKKTFALQFSEARNMKWLDRVFLATFDDTTKNVASLNPHDTKDFFFEKELKEIEAALSEALITSRG